MFYRQFRVLYENNTLKYSHKINYFRGVLYEKIIS